MLNKPEEGASSLCPLLDLLGKTPENREVRDKIGSLTAITTSGSSENSKWFTTPRPLKLDSQQRVYGEQHLLDLIQMVEKPRSGELLKRLSSDETHSQIVSILKRATQIPPSVLQINKIPKDELKATTQPVAQQAPVRPLPSGDGGRTGLIRLSSASSRS